MLFTEIALVCILAAVLGIIMDRLKQPTILGYLITGLIAAAWGIATGHQSLEVFESLGNIGVVLLLFLIGMELSAPKVKSVGKAAFLVGIGQILFTVGVGFIIAMVAGYDWLPALYLSVALAFSSTIVVVKLLGEKKELQSLHGQIAVGFLLVQDLAAIVILVTLSAFSAGSFDLASLGLVTLKGILIVVAVWALSVHIIPKVVSKLAPSPELLFLSSVAWGLGFAAFMTWKPIGFTIEAGGFLAGITLANSQQHYEILSRLRPLRDFFIMLFFVVLAIHLTQSPIEWSWLAIIGFSLFVLIGNPLIVMVIMRQLGYRSRTGFLVSLTVAQISEFSLIVIKLGQDLGHIQSTGMLGMVTIIAVITMTVSTYFITYSHSHWKFLEPWLKNFEKSSAKPQRIQGGKEYTGHAVLIGCHRTGRAILKQLQHSKIETIVMDFDPHLAAELKSQDVPMVYGDLEDVEVFDTVNLDRARIIISTVSNLQASLTLLEYLRNHNQKRNKIIIVTTEYKSEAEYLYAAGADYVNLPKLVSGTHVSHLLSRALKPEQHDFLHQRGLQELERL